MKVQCFQAVGFKYQPAPPPYTEAIEKLVAEAPAELVSRARAERCRRLLSSAKDLDEMRSYASGPQCYTESVNGL